MDKAKPIFTPVWMEELVLMYKGYNMSTIANYMHTTYSHIHKIARAFERNVSACVGPRSLSPPCCGAGSTC